MSVNPKYLKGLTLKEKKEKKENIKETRKLFKQGKKKEAAELAKKRPIAKNTVPRQSTFTTQIKKMHPGIKPNTKDFEEKTGIPILLNTSLNIDGPICQSPEDAFECFIKSDLDTLVLGNWILKKNEISNK